MSDRQPSSGDQSRSTSLPDSSARGPDVEREFIRGNLDGPGGANETYTVCRLRVPWRRLLKEAKLGLHHHFNSLPRCWECPAHIFLKAEQKYRARQGNDATSKERYSPPSAAALERWRDSRLVRRPAEALEIIQKDPDKEGCASTYTICRIAVPRERMVSEVLEGLHPGYHVPKRNKGDACHELYVKGNSTEPFDNVNFPGRNARPGFSPRELCPFRLLRAGQQLHAG